MKGIRRSPRKDKGRGGMGKDDNNETTTMKNMMQQPGAVNEWAGDDVSDDDSADPPYKPMRNDDESSDSSKFDDEDNEGMIVRSSTTMTASLMEKTKSDLVQIILTQRTQITGLKERLDKEIRGRNQSKKQVKINQNWTGEETNYADSVTQFCKGVLFPKYKFLKKGWNEYNNSRSSLSSLVKRHVTTPEGSNYESIWERVAAPTIRLKYINIKCSLNKEIQDAYKSESVNMRYVLLCCIVKQYELT